MENNKQGGRRIGAGRKSLPITQKKVAITFYPSNADIYRFGSKEKMVKELLVFVAHYNKETGIQDLTKPTHEIKPIEALKPETNVSIQLPPKTGYISPYEAYRQEISKATTIKQIEEIMVRVKGEPMIPREKMALEAYAKELSKDMFND